jgi:predicted nucleic-acid-binding protein
MIALDTNVVVRFLVEDDPKHGERASALIRTAIAAGDRLFVAQVVVCELVWVLESAYALARAEIVPVLRGLIAAEHLELETADAIRRAVDAYANGRGDLADYLIREQAQAAGCSGVATFDRALLREPNFVRP